mgnify:CR=1 FL=1
MLFLHEILLNVDGQLWVEVIKNLKESEQLVAEFHDPNKRIASNVTEAASTNQPKDIATAAATDAMPKAHSNITS